LMHDLMHEWPKAVHRVTAPDRAAPLKLVHECSHPRGASWVTAPILVRLRCSTARSRHSKSVRIVTALVRARLR
jgi:hypothetical protein